MRNRKKEGKREEEKEERIEIKKRVIWKVNKIKREEIERTSCKLERKSESSNRKSESSNRWEERQREVEEKRELGERMIKLESHWK